MCDNRGELAGMAAQQNSLCVCVQSACNPYQRMYWQCTNAFLFNIPQACKIKPKHMRKVIHMSELHMVHRYTFTRLNVNKYCSQNSVFNSNFVSQYSSSRSSSSEKLSYKTTCSLLWLYNWCFWKLLDTSTWLSQRRLVFMFSVTTVSSFNSLT